MDEEKDSRLKYVEMPREFNHKANEITIACRQMLRSGEQIAKELSRAKVNTGPEFERNEALKDFVLKSAQSTEKMLDLLTYMTGFLNDIAADAKVLIDGAILRDKLKDQSLKIENLMDHRDTLVKDLYDRRKDQINS